MQTEMSEAKKEPPAPRPATTVLLLRPSTAGDMASPLEVFMLPELVSDFAYACPSDSDASTYEFELTQAGWKP